MSPKHPDYLNFETVPTTAIDELKNDVDLLEEKLVNLGIRLSKNSRICKYRKIISDFHDLVSRKEQPKLFKYKLLHQAFYEVYQLTVITEELINKAEIPDYRFRLQQIVSGHDLPETEKTHSQARDFQFELFMAASCSCSGYDIKLKEPDIIVKSPGLTFGIAAKRPKSLNKLEHHIRKANKQIIETNLDGIIALDISLLINISNEIIVVEDKTGTVNLTQEIADEFTEKNAAKIRSLVNCERVFGIIVFMSCLCYVSSTSQVGSSTRWTVTNFCNSSDCRYNFLRNFVRQFSQGLPN